MEYITLIENSTKGLSKETFIKNLDIQHAILRRIEIIGESVKNVSQEIKQKYPEIEWKKISGMRDLLIHAYFRVDNDLVWDIIKKDIPKLKANVKIIIENTNSLNNRK